MVNRNASPELFCWDFQINAAIVLMLENIRDALNVRVEADSEDVEIKLNDATKIYAQAKAVVNPYDFNNVDEKLKEALETLNEASFNGDGSRFVYVTNSPNPFGNKRTMSSFYGNARLYYKDLPEACKKKLSRFLASINPDELDVEKFQVVVIPFESDDLNHRHRVILESINNWFNQISLTDIQMGKEIMAIWQNDFFHNGSKPDTSIEISKEDMMWPLIVLLIDKAPCRKYMNDLDEDEEAEVRRSHKEIINQQSSNYGLISMVLTGFQKEHQRPGIFIESHWQEYGEIVEGIELDDYIREHLIKIIMHKIIQERETINKLKREVGI